MILIDKMPPRPSGDTKKDIERMYEYNVQLIEQMNFILTTIQKGESDGE